MPTKSPAELAEKYGVLYVRNMTSNAPPDDRGNKPPALTINVTFHVPGRTKPIQLNVPSGKLPYKIFPGRVSLQALKEGGENFQSYLDKNMLKLVKPSAARKVLQNRLAQEESRLALRTANSDSLMIQQAKQQQGAKRNSKDGGNDYISSVRVSPNRDLTNPNPLSELINSAVAKATGKDLDHPANPSTGQAPVINDVGSNLTPQVIGIMAGYNAKTDDSKLAGLKGIASLLTIQDLHWIESHSGGKVRAWVRKHLRKTR